MKFVIMGQVMDTTVHVLIQQVTKHTSRSNLPVWFSLQCGVNMQIHHSIEAVAQRKTQCETQWMGDTIFPHNRTRIESKANEAQARKYHTRLLLNQSTLETQSATHQGSRTMLPSQGVSAAVRRLTSQSPLRNKQIGGIHRYNTKRSWRSAAMRLAVFCTKNTIKPAT